MPARPGYPTVHRPNHQSLTQRCSLRFRRRWPGLRRPWVGKPGPGFCLAIRCNPTPAERRLSFSLVRPLWAIYGDIRHKGHCIIITPPWQGYLNVVRIAAHASKPEIVPVTVCEPVAASCLKATYNVWVRLACNGLTVYPAVNPDMVSDPEA
jgi:hypothetical protein